jgi:hypothetical protein
MPVSTDPAITNPAAYGSIPVIPPTSTNVTTGSSTWTPNLPDYAALSGQASANVGNQLRGQLNPQDLANAQTWAAQRGIATGTGFNSPNNMAAYQQFLGLSAQQLEQQGLTNYNALLAGAPRTTNTTGTQTTDNNVLAATTAAAPNPYDAAMANLAAQQAGLRSGGGAVGGVGGGGLAAQQAAYQAAQQAAARAGMGTTAGGAGTAASGWSAGTGPAGGSSETVGGTTGPDVYNLGEGSYGVFGNMGSDWESLFNTGGAGAGTGGTAGTAGGVQPTGSGYMYTGANVPFWQQMGFGSEQEYNGWIDSYISGSYDSGSTTPEDTGYSSEGGGSSYYDPYAGYGYDTSGGGGGEEDWIGVFGEG